MSDIFNILDAQIEANGKGLGWGRTFLKGEQLSATRETLIKNRIELKRIKYAEKMNPAAAIFGESQVGKSYLVDNLLASKTMGSLMVFDGYGGQYNFIEQINPIGGGKESTSLVSRFTTKVLWVNKDYPIKVLLLKPVDVVLTICDSYFNDIQNPTIRTVEDIKEEVDKLKARYASMTTQQQYITEDEIFEIREYFFGKATVLNRGEVFRNNLKDAKYFESLAMLISSVPVHSWVDVFGFLWNDNRELNEVFVKLINSYAKMDFQSEVYIKIDAVLRKDGTILQVDRLYELFNIDEQENSKGEKIKTQKAKVPDMEVWTGAKSVVVKKSEFCALAAEVMMKISDQLAQEKPFLQGLDILDFPGARSREMQSEQSLNNTMACQLLIRGKVAYLFNKYSQQYLITNLLFCHHKEKSEVKTISSLLKGWIDGMVGETPEQRAEYMSRVSVPPLFLIGTKFNMDMVKPVNYHPNDPEARKEEVEGLWDTRFTNLDNLIGQQVEWFNSWVPAGTGYSQFKNVYLLRAFNYSCQTGIYVGYQIKDADGNWEINMNKDGKLVDKPVDKLVGELEISSDYKDHIDYLGKSFQNYSFVKDHFVDPKKSWEEVATVGKDGSDWIIENLTASSNKAKEMRTSQFNTKIGETMLSLCSTLRDFFHDDKSDSDLRESISNAGQVTFAMDALFGLDKYFFSEFIDKFLVRESEIHDRVLSTIRSNTMVTGTDLSMLFAIRNRSKVDPALDEEENRRRVMVAYSFGRPEQVDELLARYDFTMEDVINPPKIRNLARILVDDVEQFWLNDYITIEAFDEFVQRGMPAELIEVILQNMNVLYKEKLRITEKISDHIHPFVASPDKLTDMAEMIADICAEMINRFVNTMGTAYFDDDLWNDVRETVRRNGFDVNVDKIYEYEVDFEEEAIRSGLNEVFDTFENIDQILNQVPVDEEKVARFSNYHAYKEWTEMLKVGFMATCGIPKYDVNANNALREILVNAILKNEALAEMIARDSSDRYGMKSLQSI